MEKDFQLRRKEYFGKLQKCQDLIKNMSNDDSNKEIIDFMLLPENEEQLMKAEATLGLFEDMTRLLSYVIFGILKPIDISKSDSACFMANIVNIYANNSGDKLKEEIVKFIEKDSDFGKKYGNFLYEYLVLSFQNPEGLLQEVALKTGFDFSNEISRMQLQLLSEKAQGMVSTSDTLNSSWFLDMAKTFHERLENGIDKDNEMTAMVQELISEGLEEDDSYSIDNGRGAYSKSLW